jgi:hypothetical protein
VSRSRTFRIMTQMPRLKARRTVCVTESDFNRWRDPKKQRWPTPPASGEPLFRATRPRTRDPEGVRARAVLW